MSRHANVRECKTNEHEYANWLIRSNSLKFACYLTICIAVLFLSAPLTHASTSSVSHNVYITASIGEPRLTLYGYTSPFATVFLQGSGLFAEEMANSEGYFIFENLFVLQKVADYCLYAEDREKRTSNPICLPALPEGSFVVTVGPVILPPTVSLSKGSYLPGENVFASGETIPNSEVEIALFRKEHSPLFVRRIYAFSLPEYKINADKNGYFSFNLPSFSANNYRLFANCLWKNRETPRSNTLNFKILTIWEWILEEIKKVFHPLLVLFYPINLNFLIFFQCLFILLLFKRRYWQYIRSREN